MTKKGSTSGAKRTRPQLHQNVTAFHHNRSSKLTNKILASPISALLCPACVKVIEWRKQYRKYKPLTVPKRCIACQGKSIKAAYHTRCDACATKSDVCVKCGDARSLDDAKLQNPVSIPPPPSNDTESVLDDDDDDEQDSEEDGEQDSKEDDDESASE